MTNKTETATASASVAVPLGTVLVVLLAVAKTQNIYELGDLSWWWVFAPYWLPFLVFLGFMLVIGIVFAIGAGVLAISDSFAKRKRAKRAAERQAEMKKQREARSNPLR